jgi:uncharacterized protein DUF6261
MARSFSPVDIVTLPRLSTPAAIALGTDLLTKARALRASLPPPIARSLDRLTASFDELHAAAEIVRERRDVDPADAAAADQRLDATWGGFQSFLQGWARTPFEGEAAKRSAAARRLLDVAYPDGLKFTQLAYRLEWAESSIRLARLEQDDNAALVERLGASPFVEALRRAHDAYGVALNLTTARAELKAQVNVREPLLRFADALRNYAMIVAAHAADAPDDPEAAALAEALLAPVTKWQATGGARKGKPAPAPEGDDEVPTDVA